MLKLTTHLDVLTLSVNREKKCFFLFLLEDSPAGVQMKRTVGVQL